MITMSRRFELWMVILALSVPPVGRAQGLMQSNVDTSSPAIAPPWSMKPWLWEDDVNTAEAVWDLVEGCRDHDLPLGAILIDSPWSTRYNNFKFDEKRYPDPQGMIDALHKRNVRLVLWMTNIINTRESLSDASGDDEDLYAVGKAKGYFVNDGLPVSWWKGKGAMIDYTNPEAVTWWHRLMDRTLSLGVDGWKIDGSAELFVLTRRQTSKGVMSWRDYVDLYYRDTLNYSRTCQADFATMVRSVDIANSRGNDAAHAPFDAAPLTWTGDQRHSWTDKGLEEAIRSGFKALERNYPSVSSDTGGYQSAPKEQAERMPRLLYARWAQWNALTPFFLIGGHDEHRPWKYDKKFYQMFRHYMWLHNELVPFFYSLHVQTSLREGKLMHLGPGKHEFLLGDALLAAVMSQPSPKREITFPAGVWLDYWDNKIEHRGGETIEFDVPEDRSPLYVRLGSIIPLDVANDAVQHGSAASKGWRTLDLYPGAEPSEAAIWDTGTFPPSTFRDRSFVYLIPAETGLEIRIEGGPARDTIFRALRSKAPATVDADGKKLVQQLSFADWEKSRSGWWYDAADRRLWIRLAAVKNAQVKISE
jgi:alpha-glucosidase (family GH31 glycosyl hydrolase)